MGPVELGERSAAGASHLQIKIISSYRIKVPPMAVHASEADSGKTTGGTMVNGVLLAEAVPLSVRVTLTVSV